jgi:hypothetical protein
MKKELQKKLSKYSAAAVAVAATGIGANGQNIVYTSVNSTLTTTNPVDSVDINADGTYDAAMVIYDDPSIGLTFVLGGPLNSQGHALAGSIPSGYNYPFRLNAGEQINTQNFLPVDSAGTFTWVQNGTNPFNEFWNGGVTDGYLGLKLNVGGNTHYGWVRMDIAADGQTVVIKDMAFNSTANGAITAGQGIGLDKYAEIANSVWVDGERIYADILIEFNHASIDLIDITGKQVANFELANAKQDFDVSHLAAGTYVLSIKVDEDIINKKVVLY